MMRGNLRAFLFASAWIRALYISSVSTDKSRFTCRKKGSKHQNEDPCIRFSEKEGINPPPSTPSGT